MKRCFVVECYTALSYLFSTPNGWAPVLVALPSPLNIALPSPSPLTIAQLHHKRHHPVLQIIKSSERQQKSMHVNIMAANNTTTPDSDSFFNSAFFDLAPLLTLFGDGVTKQFLGTSMGMVDPILLAIAPIGIMTVIVSAIRVGGNSFMKSLIGRFVFRSFLFLLDIAPTNIHLPGARRSNIQAKSTAY